MLYERSTGVESVSIRDKRVESVNIRVKRGIKYPHLCLHVCQLLLGALLIKFREVPEWGVRVIRIQISRLY